MGRPCKKIALDGKAYKVVEYHPVTNLALPENSEDWIKNWEPHWEAPVIRIEECLSSDGHIIVWEKSDELGCPACTEGKACFQRAYAFFITEIKEAKKEKQTRFFRLIAKACPKKDKYYIYQHLCNREEYESLGNVIFSKFIRIIQREQFKDKCIFCPSRNLIFKSLKKSHTALVICKGCRSFFYIADCPVVMESDFDGMCPKCKRRYSAPSELELNLSILEGTYYIKCKLCNESYIFLESKHRRPSEVVRHIFCHTEYKLIFPELGKGL